MMRFIFVFLSLLLSAAAQQLTLGVAGGLRATDDAPPYTVSNSRSYIVGPRADLELWRGLGLEVDALYSRLGNTEYIPLIANESIIRTIGNAWTIPVLAKYRLPLRRVRPFLSAGYAPRYAAGQFHIIHYGYSPGDITFASTDWNGHDHAWVAGGGAEAHIGRLHISPEVRYLRWDGSSSLYLSENEVQVLVGIGWRVAGRNR